MPTRTILVGALVAILGGAFTTCDYRDDGAKKNVDGTQPPKQPTGTPQTGLPTIRLTLGEITLTVDLALTPEQRQKGLMFRTSLDAASGMLFVYPKKRYRTFWMKNTHLPLSIAFLADNGEILQIENREPFDEVNQAHSADKVHFVLEVNQGWFDVYKFGVGDQVKGLDGLILRAN